MATILENGEELKEYNQPTASLVPKMQAVAGASVGVAAVVTLLTLAGLTIPDNLSKQATEAVSAVVVLVSFVQALIAIAAGYFQKDKKPVSAIPIITTKTPKT